jgi:hypothetical protein
VEARRPKMTEKKAGDDVFLEAFKHFFAKKKAMTDGSTLDVSAVVRDETYPGEVLRK